MARPWKAPEREYDSQADHALAEFSAFVGWAEETLGDFPDSMLDQIDVYVAKCAEFDAGLFTEGGAE